MRGVQNKVGQTEIKTKTESGDWIITEDFAVMDKNENRVVDGIGVNGIQRTHFGRIRRRKITHEHRMGFEAGYVGNPDDWSGGESEGGQDGGDAGEDAEEPPRPKAKRARR